MSLRVLRLNHNRIGDAGAVALSFLVRHGGPSPSHTAAAAAAEGDGDAHLAFSLEELALNDNPIGALGVAALLQAASPPSVDATVHHRYAPAPSAGQWEVLTHGHHTAPLPYPLSFPFPPRTTPLSPIPPRHVSPPPRSLPPSHPPSQVQQYLGPEAVRTGGAALRRLGLAHTRVSLVSLHDLAGYLEAIVRVAVTLEGTHRPAPSLAHSSSLPLQSLFNPLYNRCLVLTYLPLPQLLSPNLYQGTTRHSTSISRSPRNARERSSRRPPWRTQRPGGRWSCMRCR